jgi:hypothetical protein
LSGGQRRSNRSWNTSRQPKDVLKNSQSYSPLSQRDVEEGELLMMMIGENPAQCQSQVHVTAIQGTEEPLLRTLYLWVNHDYQKRQGWY